MTMKKRRWNWDSEEQDVVAALRECRTGDLFLLNLKGSSWQVRFQRESDGGIRVELPIDSFVRDGDALSDQQLRKLRELGWTFPGAHATSNPVYVASGPHADERASKQAFRALGDVLQASPFNLGFEAFRAGGEPFSPPGMVRPRMPRDPASWFPSEPKVTAHWRYLYDNISERFGGGYATGEFVLLTDGRLFRRSITSWELNSKGQPKTVWRVSPWDLHESSKLFKNAEEAVAFLSSDGYDLSPPSPVPVAFGAGEYSL